RRARFTGSGRGRSCSIVVVDVVLGIILVLGLPIAAGLTVGWLLSQVRRSPRVSPPACSAPASPARTPDDTPKAGGDGPARRPRSGRGPRGGRPRSGHRWSARHRASSPS